MPLNQFPWSNTCFPFKHVTKDSKKYDLEERTFLFAKRATEYVRDLSKGVLDSEIGKQLVRSAGLVGANFIETNESLSKKDFIMRVKTTKKESEESKYWLKISTPNGDYEHLKSELMCEYEETMKIFTSIIRKFRI